MTKRLSILLTLAVVFVISATAQKKFSVYGVGFYNQENLFDTCHDNGKNDYEYLPTGANKWDGLKYVNKLRNMSRALADMGTDMLPNVGCAIIGLSEVENENALKDLVAQPPLAARGYQFAHIEGADQRGVDCALLYNPSVYHSQHQTGSLRLRSSCRQQSCHTWIPYRKRNIGQRTRYGDCLPLAKSFLWFLLSRTGR